MHIKSLLISVPLLSGCSGALYSEIGAGSNASLFQTNEAYQWDSGGGAGFYGSLRYENRLSDDFTLVTHYSHYSQWNVGPPFNDRAESSLDHIGVAIRYKVR